MVHLLDTWDTLLLALVLHNILDHIVMPKLIATVDTWDPHSETPIHAWLHPWLLFLA